MGPRVRECTIRPLLSKIDVEHLGLLEVNVVPGTGNSPARDRVVGIRAKVGKDLAVLRIKPPRQIANWNTAPRKLAKRTNRLAPQRHLVGTRLLKRERERFRVVGKATRPKSFPLVNWKIALAFEKRQGFPPGHEGGAPLRCARAQPTRSCAREAPLARRRQRGRVLRFQERARKREQQRTSAPHRQPHSLSHPADRPQPRPGGQIGHMERRLRSF